MHETDEPQSTNRPRGGRRDWPGGRCGDGTRAVRQTGRSRAFFRAPRQERDPLRRRRHGRVNGHRDTRLFSWRRRTTRRRSVSLHGALANLLVGFDHRRQRADDDGDDDGRTTPTRASSASTRPPSPSDFNQDGDGKRLWTLLEQAKREDMSVGVVWTARITHATPAATFAHINDRNNENAIALQALPGDATYNRRLGDGIDLLIGGGRQFFVPTTTIDDEGGIGQPDGRARPAHRVPGEGLLLRLEHGRLQRLTRQSLPVLGLFERGHMEYEYDRPIDAGGEPSVTDMTVKAIELLARAIARAAGRTRPRVLPHGRERPHRPRPSRRQRLPRADRHPGARRRDRRRRADGRPARHAHHRVRRPQPRVQHRRLSDAAAEASCPTRCRPTTRAFDNARPATASSTSSYDLNLTTGDVEPSDRPQRRALHGARLRNGPGYRGAARVDPRHRRLPGPWRRDPDGP